MREKLKITGPNLFGLNFSASALESNSLAGPMGAESTKDGGKPDRWEGPV
jgi:hypothetical protein